MSDGTPIIIKKKKSHGGHGHHGGSWKVAYADFVTAMWAFFMVMWIMGLSDQTRSMIQGYFNDPLGFAKNEPKGKVNVGPKTDVAFRKPKTSSDSQSAPQKDNAQDPAKADEAKIREIKQEIQKDLGSDKEKGFAALLKHVDIVITPEGLRIEFIEAAGAVFFESGQAVIRPEAAKLIARIAPVLKQSARKIAVEGHTDAAPYPSQTYSNWDLSSDRARALLHALQADGLPYEQFSSVNGLADTHLRRPDKPLDFSNRRVSLLLPFKPAVSAELELPKDAAKRSIEGAFKRPVDLAPPAPGIADNPTH